MPDETPDQMTRRVLAELYPRPPHPLTQAFRDMERAIAPFAALLGDLMRGFEFAPTEPCRLCGCGGGHHEGCPLA
ncbi:hypothetical protein DEIPH_ctg011orf0041 [Deinococcus phoenicis]|uniref:Uncharacterized protein n=1 Tax=Deinococcus phoenicis TaxID=1476583 RepID=A0A016QTI5_9DEIO|nr:hypothetical protein [Deinococcus phoenicis]EYB69074.1 hypothetical protein DEIPH_ctg011orf0041 [Deinococcus phoenicis]